MTVQKCHFDCKEKSYPHKQISLYISFRSKWQSQNVISTARRNLILINRFLSSFHSVRNDSPKMSFRLQGEILSSINRFLSAFHSVRNDSPKMSFRLQGEILSSINRFLSAFHSVRNDFVNSKTSFLFLNYLIFLKSYCFNHPGLWPTSFNRNITSLTFNLFKII